MMRDHIKKEDARVSKTRVLLLNAMTTLLKARNFNQMTVNELCKEALVSRTTFYAHFLDKYDLLRHWLSAVAPVLAEGLCAAQPEAGHKRILKHLVEGADEETSELLRQFLLRLSGFPKEPGSGEQAVFHQLWGGALLHYLAWQVQQQFPLPLRNAGLSRFLEAVKEAPPFS